MAMIETWFDQDLLAPVPVHVLSGVVFDQDSLGNLIGVRITKDGEPVTLTGSVNGYCILSDGSTIPVDGSRDNSGNSAWIVLPQSAYLVLGTISIVIKLTDGNTITTLCACVGTVRQSKTSNMVEPGSTVITDWSQQISAELQACQDVADSMGTNLASTYSTSATYPVGSYVMYNGTLYRCVTAVTTAGSWSSNSSKFVATKLANDVADLKSALNTVIDETRILAPDEIEYTSGHFYPPTKTYTPATDRVFTSLIPCEFNGMVLSYIKGYPFVYYTYNSLKTLTGSYDSVWNFDRVTVNNKGGYIVIIFGKIGDGTVDFDSDDITALQNGHIVQNRFFETESREATNVSINVCYRVNVSTKSVSPDARSERAFTSLIYCEGDSIVIPYVEGYLFNYALYDKNRSYVSKYDSTWLKEDTTINNKGGYVVIVFLKSDNTAFTGADVTAIESGLNIQNILLKNISERSMIQSTDDYNVTIGRYNASSKSKTGSQTDRAFTSLIKCEFDGLIIPYVAGYTFVYYLYDSSRTLTGSYDSVWNVDQVTINNKGGYVAILFGKMGFGTLNFSSDDVTAIKNKFKIPNRYKTIEDHFSSNIDFSTCHRITLQTKAGSPATDSERAFTSLIYCNTDNTTIPYIPGYSFVYALFDGNRGYTSKNDASWIAKNYVISNKGGYVLVEFVKNDGTEFNSTDIQKLKNKFRLLTHSISIAFYPTQNSNKPILTIVDDDGGDGFYNSFYPMFMDKGVKATAAIVTDNVGKTGHMTLSNLLEMKEDGFDFISHSADHSPEIFGTNVASGNYTNFSLVQDSAIIASLKRSRDYLVKYGFNGDGIAWPYGHYPMSFDATLNNPDPNDANVCGADNQRWRYAKIARQLGYKYGLNSIGDTIIQFDIESMWIPRLPFWSDNTTYPVSYYEGKIDLCINRNGWLILMTHANMADYGDATKMASVIDYALAHGVEVKTFKEGYALKQKAMLGDSYDDFHRMIISGTGDIFIK